LKVKIIFKLVLKPKNYHFKSIIQSENLLHELKDNWHAI